MDYIVIIGAIIAFSSFCSITRKGFSTNVFMASFAISIMILIWKNMLPVFSVIFVIIITIGLLFSAKKGEDIE